VTKRNTVKGPAAFLDQPTLSNDSEDEENQGIAKQGYRRKPYFFSEVSEDNQWW
jgi:hypothetical protein